MTGVAPSSNYPLTGGYYPTDGKPTVETCATPSAVREAGNNTEVSSPVDITAPSPQDRKSRSDSSDTSSI
jgi:hypothetical protein